MESVKRQSVLPKWIIIRDDPADDYVERAHIPQEIFQPAKIRKPRWWIRHHNPFNDYFNQVLTRIPDGNFIIYLDDDDMLLDPTWVATILERDADVLVGKFQLGPAHDYALIGTAVERGKIGGSCVAVRSEIARQHPWPLRGGGDFMFIRSLAQNHEFVWEDRIVAGVQSDLNHSWGRRSSY
ncbi:MAG: hypothetical protein K9N11_09270 [Lentisphaeria bacterium]|nr:hypothetical protein [Candidatus Neomarinimicrobiota bacterium]MCF7843028.1 hypothetical protein [Lentisphaeria bacterium]